MKAVDYMAALPMVAILAIIEECGCDRIYRVEARDLTDLIVTAAETRGRRVRSLTEVPG